MVYSLKNGSVSMGIDEKGMLQSLKCASSPHDYAGGGGLWRLIYSRGLELEREVSAENCIPEITSAGDSLKLHYPRMKDEDGELSFSLTLTAELEGEDIVWSVELANNEKETVIREFHFPIISACRIKEDQSLIWSREGGQRFWNVYKEIRSHHTAYMAKDNKEVRATALYPGQASMNAFTLEDGADGLYCGCHDPVFPYTLHLLGATEKDVNLGMVRYPFIASGEMWKADGFVLTPYQGTWHLAAEKYRAWADSWFTPDEPPESIRGMCGWQRIILRHQYGEIHYRYDQLEEMYRDGAEAGIDTLFLFGWHKYGMDAGYPDYAYDESQGGFEVLKKNIAKVRKAGGKVILYFNGQLIDKNSEFYEKTGRHISIKKHDGNEHTETYPFGGNGTALRVFGNKTFVTACPACAEWLEVLKKLIDKALALEADGVFFDQLGFMSYPCFDGSHGHKVPLMDLGAKSSMLKKIREYVKALNPEMSLGTEWLSDATAQHVDFVHSVSGGAGSPSIDDWRRTGEKPSKRPFMSWFYYAFPEVRSTDREIRDGTDVQRRVNRALLKGLRSDVEIYRCRKTIAEIPEYSGYLDKANGIRQKYKDLILNGRFRDTRHFSLDTDALDAASFVQGNRLAVVLTQSHTDRVLARLAVPGGIYEESDGLNVFSVREKGKGELEIELDKDALCVAVFTRE